MDQFRIQLGMPRCIYHKLNDPEVEPKEHVVRALGGPVFNMMVLPFTCLARRVTRPDSIAGATARTAFQTNLFLSLISLLPIPGIDGAPILKWSLVERGKTVAEADEVVRKANGPLAILLGLTSSVAFLKKKPLIGFFSLMLGGISLSVYTGLLKEEDVSI
jgi:Zn-dependent protease